MNKKGYWWILGTVTNAMQKLRSLTPMFFATPVEFDGNIKGNSRVVPAGKVAWPVEKDKHDGNTFIASDSFPAEYVHKERKVYMLDEPPKPETVPGFGVATGATKPPKRHDGQKALIVGKNVFLATPLYGDTIGFVDRTAQFGSEGLLQNVFHPSGAYLIAHHLQPRPPEHSTQVYDVDGRHGGIHVLTRVRRWIRELCGGGGGQTVVPGQEEPKAIFAPLLNGCASGDGTPGHLGTHFSQKEALLSHEGGGFARPSSRKHDINSTGEAPVAQGALDIDTTIHSDGTDEFSAPFDWDKSEWEPCGRGPFPRLVRTRMVSNAVHQALCGLRKGMWREQTWSSKTAADPSSKSPVIDDPPDKTGDPIRKKPKYPPFTEPTLPDPVRKQGGDPGAKTPGYGAPSLPPADGRPTNSGPHEEEQPSTRGIPAPSAADNSYGYGPGAYDIPGISPDTAFYLANNFTVQQFWNAPRVSHDVALAQHLSATRNDSGPEPWPVKYDVAPTMTKGPDGRYFGKRGHGPGSQVLMPGGLEGHIAFKALHGHALPSAYTPTLTRIFLNYKSGSNEVRTYPGLGFRVPDQILPASGWYGKLDYTDSDDAPHIDWRSTDANALDSATGRQFKINGNSAASAAAAIPDNDVVRGDGGSAGLQGSGLTLADLASDNVSLTGKSRAGGTGVTIRGGTNTTTDGAGKNLVIDAGEGNGAGVAGNVVIGTDAQFTTDVDIGNGAGLTSVLSVLATNGLRLPNATYSSGPQTLGFTQTLVLDTGGITINLPASPAAVNDGHLYILRNNAKGSTTLGRNGSNINGSASDQTIAAGTMHIIWWDNANSTWRSFTT